jgi:hypothetical protein
MSNGLENGRPAVFGSRVGRSTGLPFHCLIVLVESWYDEPRFIAVADTLGVLTPFCRRRFGDDCAVRLLYSPAPPAINALGSLHSKPSQFLTLIIISKLLTIDIST